MLAALALGCTDSPSEPTDPGGPDGSVGPAPVQPVDQFTIAAPRTTINTGRSLQLTATARRAGEDTQLPSADILWQSSDRTVATVTASGLVRALRPGQVDIRASYQTNRAVVRITVLKSLALPGCGNGGRCL